MASEENGSPYWGQLIFTHDSKPPVLISKDLVRLGRKEGKNVTWNCFSLLFAQKDFINKQDEALHLTVLCSS